MANLLIIEDEPDIRANLRRFLTLEGHDVAEAADGEQGIAAAKALPPMLIFCDVRMPKKNGFEVLAALRADPATASIPFVFISASAEERHKAEALNLGAHDYVTKPFDLAGLRALLKQRLGG